MHPLRVVHDLRPVLPWTIYSLPIAIEHGPEPAVYERRFAIKWDEDNDPRVFAAVLDVYFRRPETLWNLYAIGEHKAKLSIWAANFSVTDQNAWMAATRGPAIQDAWSVEGIKNAFSETVRTGGRQVAAEDEILRKFPAEHDELNLLIKLFDLGPEVPRRPW